MKDNHKYSARWRDRTLKRILYNRERTAPNGAGETERRRQQIAAGRLKPENGLVQVNPAGWQEVDGVALPPITWADVASTPIADTDITWGDLKPELFKGGDDAL